MEVNGKVTQKREKAIQRAAAEGNWGEVLRLLDQPFLNSLRRDRKYGLSSLNSKNEGGSGELLDTISDNQNPLTLLIQEEESKSYTLSLCELKDIEREIFLERTEYGWSFSKLAKMHNISDKTAKKHYENAREKMEKNFTGENII
uniref:sigma factor-like helix-turn-helix DNA-binding protein n=1 Tax=Streptococcus pluranimalium TaxID=82348 RepID=UPI003F69246E